MPATAIEPNEEKLRELIIYLASKCEEDVYFGATKLNKLLYFIDSFAYAQLGRPVTGVEYMKQEQGPVPRRLLPVKRQMEEDGDVVEIQRAAFGMPKPQKRLIARRPPKLTMFTAEEIAHIDGILEMCKNASARQLSDLTHRWKGWKIARSLGDTIPYSAIFLSDDPPTDYEIQRGLALAAERGWNVH